MDAQSLKALFDASFHLDPNVRMAAELELRKVEGAEGMVSAVLQLLSSPDVPFPTQQAASVYLKNRLARSWSTDVILQTDKPHQVPIPESDRLALKRNLLHVLVSVIRSGTGSSVKTQLQAALGTVVDSDFPEQWPDLSQQVLEALQSHDLARIEAALLVLVQIHKLYRFSRSKRAVPDGVMAACAGLLCSMGNEILASAPSPACPPEAGQLLYLIFKVYSLSIRVEISTTQQADESIVPWGKLMLAVVARPLDPAAVPDDLDDRERFSWWRAKKWAYRNLNALFVSFGCLSHLRPDRIHYKPFAKHFQSTFAPEILRLYLVQIEHACSGTQWLSERCRRLSLEFLTNCIKPKDMWALLRPHVDAIVAGFVFPTVCMSDDEILQFDEDPVEFAKTHYGSFVEDYFRSPASAASDFIESLVSERPKSTLGGLLSFINSVVTQYPAKYEARQKDGALRMMLSLVPFILKSEAYKLQLEPFFVNYIIPEFDSGQGYLRARACELAEACERLDLPWKNLDDLQKLFACISKAMSDPALPTRVQAAIALPELIRYDTIRDVIAPQIGPLMQQLLDMQSALEHDALTETSRQLVANFSDELIPFAAELTGQLTLSLTRILQENYEAEERAKAGTMDDSEAQATDDRTITAIGLIKTILQLASSVESSPELLGQVEERVMPALAFILQHSLFELYDDAFELIDALTYHRKMISEPMWKLFELTHRTFSEDGIDFLDDMMPSLDNFIAVGREALGQHAEHKAMLLDMLTTVMTSDRLGAEDRASACKLAETAFLNLNGHFDEGLAPLIGLAMQALRRQDPKADPVISDRQKLHCITLIICAINYDTAKALAVLAQSDSVWPFFSIWFANLEELVRVFDRKLGIAAICNLLQALPSLPDLASAAPQLLAGCVTIFAGLPTSIKSRVELDQAFEVDSDDEDGADDAEGDSAEPDDRDDEDADDGTGAGGIDSELDEDEEEDDEEDDDDLESTWSEEVMYATPMDDFDSYRHFASVLSQLESANPEIYAAATRSLTVAQQSELAKIAHQASHGGEAKLVSETEAAENKAAASAT
ncbi:uncharacterized protein L969DRAFT_70042 [Mixia osmundae IAM 14324]|uniref:Importin N-terminal domain-containing protein n=1 Tax=Mixia osmundae (strain CBS 9802 / IAM 14324 / JCM 22182 / KY 12970) TaxID=764103 RepID=G7DT65_MIXOS|nr:uncharacterized protein L969DRAFT_70042 [Mixia osmundae IAM 14324]KEI42722.1 hypothetical protein L969DRAFT_70042 [Mixia osmundae IAM 14324]GAA93944.1 hypothetical protein E5Q_00590 [Mixia osmundae IAM 14324]